MSPKKFTDIMLEIIRYAQLTQNLTRADINTSIHNIFKEKSNIFAFITEVKRLLNIWSLYLTNYQTTIAVKLQALYTKKTISCKPTREIECYLRMLSVAINDWTQFAIIIKTLVDDPEIDEQLFYIFLNKCFQKSYNKKTSIIIDVQDTHLRQQLNLEKVDESKCDELWMQRVFNDYDHIKFLKTQKHLNKTTSNITKPNKESIVKEFGHIPKRPTFKRSGLSPQERQERAKRFRNWIETTRPLLKQEFKSKMNGGYCAAHHMESEFCRVRNGRECRAGNKTRKHECICGSMSHTISHCKSIYA